MALLKLKGVVQNYAWGGTEYIPNLIGEEVTGEKCAEYWMGAHDKAPATITSTGQTFNDYITAKIPAPTIYPIVDNVFRISGLRRLIFSFLKKGAIKI